MARNALQTRIARSVSYKKNCYVVIIVVRLPETAIRWLFIINSVLFGRRARISFLWCIVVSVFLSLPRDCPHEKEPLKHKKNTFHKKGIEIKRKNK